MKLLITIAILTSAWFASNREDNFEGQGMESYQAWFLPAIPSRFAGWQALMNH